MISQASRSSAPTTPDADGHVAASSGSVHAPAEAEQQLRTLEALESVRRQLDQTQRTLDEFVARLGGAPDPERRDSAA